MLETKELVLDRSAQGYNPTRGDITASRRLDIGKENHSEMLRVLDRAADDCAFIAQLTDQPSEALQGYILTWEEKAALLSGDIVWTEAHVGKLDARLRTWLWSTGSATAAPKRPRDDWESSRCLSFS